MRVGTDRTKHQIQIPLPPKIDPTVTMMTVEEKPDVTYNEVGGNKEQIEKMREVVELPMLHPVRTPTYKPMWMRDGVDVLRCGACRSGSWHWASIRQKVCCCTGRQAQGRRCWLELWPIAPMHALFA